MTNETKQYRLGQIAKLKNGDFDYAPKVQLFGGLEGKTHHFDITKDEWVRICQVLTEGSVTA